MWLPPSLQSRQRQAAIKVGSVLNSNLMAPHAHFAVCFFAIDHLRCVGTVERRFEKSIWFSATPIAGHAIRVRERPAWGCLEVIDGWPGVFHHRHQVWRHRWDLHPNLAGTLHGAARSGGCPCASVGGPLPTCDTAPRIHHQPQALSESAWQACGATMRKTG